jgi:long-chain acyl-CoA synthetase
MSTQLLASPDPPLRTRESSHLYMLLQQRARAFPFAVALGGQHGLIWKTIDSGLLLDLVDRLATELAALGIQSGDRVVLWVPNQWRTPVYLFALWKLGAVVVAFDHEMNPEAGARIVASVAPRCIIVGYPEQPTWAAPASLTEWWEPGTCGGAPARTWEPPAEELATISFTSGTTGDPKGCMITHANLYSQIEAARERIPIDQHSRLASILPLSHLFELTAGMLYPLAAGAAIHYIPSRRGPDILRVLSEQRITHVLVVPQLLVLLGDAIEDELQRRLSGPGYAALRALSGRLPLSARRALFFSVHRTLGGHLRLLASGGAPLAPETQRLWETLGIRVVQGYGASECSPIIACGANDGSTPVGSVGKVLRGMTARLSPTGELLIKGPNVMRGYWQAPARTAEVLDLDGWYATGDLARIDEAGNIWLLGRARDLIVLPSGMKVWPEDVEAVLRAHPAIQDAAVVSMATPAGGATLHAYLLPALALDRTADLVSIVAECNARLAQHQRLASASWWEGTDFPRTTLMKVRRHLLPQPRSIASVHVESVAAADDPVGQAIAGVAGVPAVQSAQTLAGLGLDSLGLLDLALALEDKTGNAVADGDLRLDMTVADVRSLLRTPRLPADAAERTPRRLPLWPYTWGRALRILGAPIDLLYRLGVTRTVVLGSEHLADLPARVIFAGNHHSFPDLPLIRHALSTHGRAHSARRLVTAIAAENFNSGGPQLGGGLGLYPWYGIVALGLYPLRQRTERQASLRGLARVMAAGNDVLIFPQGIHATPEQERADDPAVRFRPGVYHLANAFGVPVVPFGLAGTERIMPYKPSDFHGRLVAGIPLSIHRGPLAVAFGEPLVCQTGETAEAFDSRLQQRCYALARQAEQALA